MQLKGVSAAKSEQGVFEGGADEVFKNPICLTPRNVLKVMWLRFF